MPTRDKKTKRTFRTFLEVHDNLNELFFAHQEAILKRDAKGAIAGLDAFERELIDHMTMEEADLFPIYERALPIEGGSIELYSKEHKKLRRMVERVREALPGLRFNQPGAARRMLEVLDYETQLKNLLIHHDLRERNIFYPAIDEVATDKERERILGRR